MPSPVRVLIVDDVPQVREDLARLLARLDDIDVVSVAGDGAEAVDKVAGTDPQVVIMDLRLPGVDGIEATRRIVADHPEVAVLVLSAYGDESLVIEALMAGARGYLLKGMPATELVEAIVGAASGEARIAGAVTRPVLERLVEALGMERETRRAAEEARLALARLSEHQQQFATMAAHELRTPVTALLGSLTTLERLCKPGKLDGWERELLLACTRQARRLTRLIQDLMVVAEGASGGIAVNPKVVEVGQVIASVVGDLDHLGPGRVKVRAMPALHAWVDPDRLAQVLTNLLRNAIQYSPPGTPVEVTAKPAPGVVRVAVADQGPGIPPERLPHLFDRFGRSRSGDRRSSGLGVGLWTVRELLTAMQGSVWVETNPGSGSTFWIAVPSSPG